MEKLAGNERELLAMRYRENASSREIAGRLGRTAEAVRRHLFRLREALLRCIDRNLQSEEV